MKVYISIPISGLDETKQRDMVGRIAKSIKDKGDVPVNPFEVDHGEIWLTDCGDNSYIANLEELTYEDYLCADLRAMLDCDAIYFCKGWESSCGCNIEHQTAKIINRFKQKKIKFIYE